MDALPEQLLGRVLALAGVQEGGSVTLVSKRWRHAFYSEPALWRRFRLQLYPERRASHPPATPTQLKQWFANKYRLLQRVAGMVAALEVHDADRIQLVAANAADSCQLSDFLGLLHSRVLAAVEFKAAQLPADLVHPLLALPHLGAVRLACQELPPAAAAAISRLTQLRSLGCDMRQLTGRHLDAILQLSALTQLELASHATLPPLQQLTRLSRLAHLGLRNANFYAHPMQLPAPADFAALQTYSFSAARAFQVAGVDLPACRCYHPAGTSSAPNNASSAGAVLELGSPRQLHSLEALLATLVPAGASSVSLHIRLGKLGAAALQGGGAYPAAAMAPPPPVRALHLDCCSAAAGSGGMEVAAAALLCMLPEVDDLTVTGSRIEGQLAEVPERVAGMGGLRKLGLPGNQLVELPEGPYLTGLECLDLSNNCLTALPPALAAATRLRRLSLSGNADLALTLADVDGILLRMPALRLLELGVVRMPAAVLVHLGRSMPQLQVV